jgi:TPR repeat protein
VATSCGNLASLFVLRGDLAQARPLYERALVIREQALGSEHLDTARSLNNLARLLEDQGDLGAARPLFERALKIRENALGPEHARTRQSFTDLARVLQAQGDLSHTLPPPERAPAIREKTLGPEPDDPARELLTSAEGGDPEAQNALGRFYAQHGSVANSTEIAEAWFRRAADQGLAPAKHNLGVLALRADREDLAQSWFRAAADDGWLPSIFALGDVLESAGQDQEAARLYEIAANRGSADAQDALGRMMFELETQEGYEKSRRWSELAAAQGVASADTRLATIYHEGLGVDRDPQRAAAFFLRAARAGHPGAQLMIGIAYHVGAGVEANRLEAAFWLSLVADEDSIARHYLTTRVDPNLTQDEKIALEARLRQATTL